jgi:uncharacterized protein
MNRLGPAALTVRRIHAVAGSLVPAGIVLGADVALRMAGAEPPVPVGVVPVAVLVVVAVLSVVMAGLVHRSWAWVLEPDHLRVDRGVIIRRSSLVPRRRVQHVSTHVGPLQRRFRLTSIEVHTAGARTPNVVVEHLETATADRLRAELATGAVPHDVA